MKAFAGRAPETEHESKFGRDLRRAVESVLPIGTGYCILVIGPDVGDMISNVDHEQLPGYLRAMADGVEKTPRATIAAATIRNDSWKRRTNWVRAISDIMIGLALIASMVLIVSEFPDPTLWQAGVAALVAVAFCAHMVPILAKLAKS